MYMCIYKPLYFEIAIAWSILFFDALYTLTTKDKTKGLEDDHFQTAWKIIDNVFLNLIFSKNSTKLFEKVNSSSTHNSIWNEKEFQ